MSRTGNIKDNSPWEVNPNHSHIRCAGCWSISTTVFFFGHTVYFYKFCSVWYEPYVDHKVDDTLGWVMTLYKHGWWLVVAVQAPLYAHQITIKDPICLGRLGPCSATLQLWGKHGFYLGPAKAGICWNGGFLGSWSPFLESGHNMKLQ